MATTVKELTVEDMEAWNRDRNMDKQRLSDTSWRNFQKENYVKVCSCGIPYSYPRNQKDPKACQGCRGEEGELVY